MGAAKTGSQLDLRSADPISAGYVLPLTDVTRQQVDRAGSKAANLGELARAGFPVPEGFVVTTQAFDQFLSANALGSDSSRGAATAARIPAGIEEAIRAATRAFAGMALAVRSSGVAEDLEGASYAGQYETVLDVRGADAVVDAVRRCWASAFNARVAEYRRVRGESGIGRMAVLVQRLVPADAAGVAFTANPVTGDRQETVVSAVRGLGERLVSGQASPDEWIVRGREILQRSAPENAIGADQAGAVAALARRVEAHLGAPQDIEWALAAGQLFLLQARPITALGEPEIEPVPMPIEVPAGFWKRETHDAHPPSPMSRSLSEPLLDAGFKAMCDEYGFLAERLEIRAIGGWNYIRVVPLGGNEGPAPPAWLMPVLIRVVPSLRRRIQESVRAMRADRPGENVRRWNEEWRTVFTRRNAELRDLDRGHFTDAELEIHLDRAVAHLAEGVRVHFIVNGAWAIVVGEFAFACRDLLGWHDAQVVELLSGLSTRSSEPGRRLAELGRIAGERSPLRAVLERIDDSTLARLAEVDPEFAAAFAAYQRDFGTRALRYEVAERSLAEVPALLLGLVRDQLARAYEPERGAAELKQRRQAVLAEARTKLAGRPQELTRFERLLRRAEAAYPTREDNEFYTFSATMAVVRYVLLEIGQRLAQRGVIATRDDIFFLELQEARVALRSGGDLREQVRRRKSERVWTLANPGPASYGEDPGPPPSLKALPPEARLAMEALAWSLEGTEASAESHREQSGDRLIGVAASPGRYTGTVRVILDESEFGKLRAGDVLVCSITTPVWSVLFANIGALVTDMGGILSHPAIIAREFGIPAVVATGSATRLLRDGQRVTVDGRTGRVEVHS